jgi:ATP-dependent DNA helicase RecG
MNLEELNIILSRGENIRTEFKEAREKVPCSFYHTVVSFLNREGGVIVLSLDAFSPYAKNPAIRKFFSEFRWTDELGSGVKNVKKYLKIYANGAKPVFIEDDKFLTIIPLSNPVFGDKAELVLSFVGLDIASLPKELPEEMRQLSLLPEFSEIDDPDTFLFQKGSSWVEKGGKLEKLRMNNINELQFGDFQKGGSWAEKGGKLFPKRTLNILKALIICLIAVKLEELRVMMGYGSLEKLRELYLNPLRNEGIVETTIKDKPNAPEQKYILTEKGRMFLGGFEVK